MRVFEHVSLVRVGHVLAADEQPHLHRRPRHKRFEVVQTVESIPHRGFSTKHVCCANSRVGSKTSAIIFRFAVWELAVAAGGGIGEASAGNGRSEDCAANRTTAEQFLRQIVG